MARWWFTRAQQQAEAQRLAARNQTAAATGKPPALVAAAQAVRQSRDRITANNEGWQNEAWGFYEDLGEFNFAVDWKANKMSRVRLRAARLDPGQDEPVIEDSGLASELVEELAGDPAAQSELMSSLSVQLQVPGECYLIGEENGERNFWRVFAKEEIRVRGERIEVIDDEPSQIKGKPVYRQLNPDAYITRIWRPDKRMRFRATSSARAARPIMRELELVNRHIQSQYLSRLASAGVFLIPEEITFPVREEFQDAPDPFVLEWMETAKEAIATPGTAAAIVPIPMRIPGEWIEKVQYLDFTPGVDEKILDKRESAIRRLATKLEMPTEVLLGVGDVNHWGQWFIDEDGIKTYIAPDAEVIVRGLTIGYLHPRMEAAGEDPADWVVWYDTSELTQRPDKSANAVLAYDRFELSGGALRRETGFSEEDVPDEQELRQMALKYMLKSELLSGTALQQLAPGPAPEPATQPGTAGPEQEAEPETSGNPGEPPASEPEPVAAGVRLRALTPAEAGQHLVKFGLAGWTLLHPSSCGAHPYTCPLTWAMRDHPNMVPGTSGVYRLRLTDTGSIVLGERTYEDNEQMIPTRVK